jgi:hypothetical protein
MVLFFIRNPDVVGSGYLYVRQFRGYLGPLKSGRFAWGGQELEVVLVIEKLLQAF